MTISHSQWSVRTHLLWLVLACLLPGVIGAIALLAHQYREGREQQERATIQTARALAQVVDNHLDKSQAIAQVLSMEKALLRQDYLQFHEAAREVLALSGIGTNIVVRDETGQQLVNTALEFGLPLPRQPLPEAVRRVFATGKPVISDLFMGLPLRRPIMSVNVPVFINGKVAYVLGIGILPTQFNAILNAQNVPPGWVAAVFDSSGTIVGRSRRPEDYVGKKLTGALLQAISTTAEGSVGAITQEGFPVMSAYSRSPSTRWGVAIGIPSESLAEALVPPLSLMAAGVAALFGIGLVMAWYTGGKIAYSVQALTAPAMALGNGGAPDVPAVHFREAAEVGSAIGRAAGLLGERTAALKARETELAHAHSLLRNVIDSSPAVIYVTDLNGNFLLFNKTYERLIGVDPFAAGKGARGLVTSLRGDGLSAADRHVIDRAELVQVEEKIDTVEGLRYFTVSKGPLRDSGGRVIGVCAAAVDITSLKVAEAKIRMLVDTLERRVTQRTDELNQANVRLLSANARLQEANEHLEAFSYTVAHDLRAPLRGIQGFADAVQEDFDNRLDDTGRDYLRRISRAAGRMERLIEDLLSFSRLSRQELSLGTVSLDEVFAEVMANLGAQIAASQAGITLAPHLPPVRANKSACLHVFQNLVSNAIKFARADTPPRIRIWPESRKDEQNASAFVRICIEDNGIGIPATQLHGIFKPFERLHGMDEYPGNGIGLAVVEKAVRRMHGQCGVESEAGRGSRFWVELPVARAGE